MGKRGWIAWGVILVALFSVLVVGTISAKESKTFKAEQNVLDKISEEGKARVIVTLKGPAGAGKYKGLHKFTSMNAFSASLTGKEIAKLEGDANVEKIMLDMPVKALLQNSVSLVNGTNTWNLQKSGTNLTGKGQTICVIDTGIDYTHPDLGNCTIKNDSLVGNVVNNVTQSAHNYADNFSYTWNITYPGFTNIAVHFDYIETEVGYDYVLVYDNNSVLVASYSGRYDEIWTPSVSGDTIRVRLVSDENLNYDGFYIDKLLNGTASMSYSWSNCSKVIGGYDFVEADEDPIDDNGHGTHVGGIAAANGVARGVAPDASIIAIKALDFNGDGYTSDIASGIEWCISNASIFNISVISMSLGGDTKYATYCDMNDSVTSAAINSATSAGIAVVIASGNNVWTDGISAPACIQNAVPVGSIRKNDATLDYSRNWMVQLLAPGYQINSTKWEGGYDILSGTSMATPHVAGAFAIARQFLELQNDSKTPQQLENVFNSTGRIIPDAGSGLNFSRIDIYEAIFALDEKSPEVELILPFSGYANNSAESLNLTFVCNASDFALKNMTFYIWNSTGNYNSSSISASGANASIEVGLSNIAQGEYFWNCMAYDERNNSAYAAANYSLVYDLAAPNVTLTSPDNGYSATGTTTISFGYNASELIGIKNCSLIVNGAIVNYNSSAVGDTNTISRSMGAGSYTWSINCTDLAGNSGNSSARSLTINAETTDEGGGGGGGGGGYSYYIVNASNMEEGYTKTLNRGDKIRFALSSSQSHTLTLDAMGTAYANISIRSEPLNVTLLSGQSMKLNFSFSDYYDIMITLNSITGAKANITINSIHEPIIKHSNNVYANTTARNITPEIKPETQNTPKNETAKYRAFTASTTGQNDNTVRRWTNWITCGAVFLAVIAFIIYTFLKPKRKKNVGARIRT